MSNHSKISRREILRLAALGAFSAFITACERAGVPVTGNNTPAAAPTQDVITQNAPTPDLQSLAGSNSVPITSAENFYITSSGPTPKVPANWKLTITGLVDNPLTLTLDDIKAMSSVTEMRTLSCISNPVGGNLISNAVWKGVQFKELLTQAGVKNNAHFIKFESFDGYSTSIPLELGIDDHSLLVYDMNGAPLPSDHGAPLRCLWPGHYGMKQPKWLQTVTLVEQYSAGYWERQGWSSEAKVLPFSRIDSPQDLAAMSGDTFTLSGIAFSNESSLSEMEISWDDTNQWQTTELTRGPSPLVWTVWTWTGKSLPAGRHVIYARATDGNGQMQVRAATFSLFGSTFPNGTLDMQSIVLDFKG
ncbi:MAG: molybdopterin-dependent oxidoreductase [Chloroflexi bacterium]|nr:molybdopterin-dependent oxidoreductase [Chloroflexota bacterium]